MIKDYNNYPVSKDEIVAARNVEIIDILEAFSVPYKKCGSYYQTIEHDSLKIKGNQYNWYSRGTFGNCIDFLIEYLGFGFVDAVKEIIAKTNASSSTGYTYTLKKASFREIDHINEWNVEDLNEAKDKRRAIAYLCHSRGLSYSIVSEMIFNNIVSQDKNGCILFKVSDENNNVVGAERRSTIDGSKFRQTIKGTNSNYGVNLKIGKPNNAYFFESSIDMISYYEMYKSQIKDSVLVSMRGLKPRIIEETQKRYEINFENIYLCVDDDKAGKNFAEKIIDKNNKVRRILVNFGCKDWNERLIKSKIKSA